MKAIFSKKDRVNKGAPSGFLISLLFHVGAFFIAGLFVVFTIVNRPEPEFEPPPLMERPKMKLKKPKVKVRKSSNPKPSSRIVAKVKTKEMPEIQLPDLVGAGDGLLDGSGLGGEFMDVPEIRSLSLLGSTESVGADLIGTYYDFKRSKSGSPRGVAREQYLDDIYNFIKNGWDATKLAEKYFTLPTKLYMTTLIVPVIPSNFAPVAFGDVDAAEGRYWMVHYTGTLVHKEGITFRFWAAGDGHLVVALDGEVVCASAWDTRDERRGHVQQVVGSDWIPKAPEHRQYIFGHDALASVGEWITLEPGEQKKIDITIGDEGGLACFYLAVEEQGVEYETSSQGGPILPAFKTTEMSDDLIDIIYPALGEDEMVCLTNGPVFNDIGVVARRSSADRAALATAADEQDGMRTWSLVDGRTFQAEYANRVSFDENIIFEDANGDELRIAMDQLSREDREYLDIIRVPKLEVDLLRKLPQVMFSSKTAENHRDYRDPEIRARFGVRVKQVGSGTYPHQLTAEVFAIGRQIYADRYIVLARETVPFHLTRENDRTFEYVSDRWVPLRDYHLRTFAHRGEKYHGYQVIIRDTFGNVVAHEESPDWLFDNLDNLIHLQPGNHFDKHCVRQPPIRPEPVRNLAF
jgi:hypothetical protein